MNIRYVVLIAYVITIISIAQNAPVIVSDQYKPLTDTPASLQRYHEIAVLHQQNIAQAFNNLDPVERIMCYYLARACYCGNQIASDQLHRYALELQTMFKDLYQHRKQLQTKFGRQFVREVRDYFLYVFTNHGPYFLREHIHNKRTPHILKFKTLTPANLIKALKEIGHTDAEKRINALRVFLTDNDYESTLTVKDAIERSAVNTYEKGFTTQQYAKLQSPYKGALNARYALDEHENPFIELYKVGGRCGKALEAAVFWLQKALVYGHAYSRYFDTYFLQSLEFLIQFLITGDENYFKEHSRVWVKHKCRVDYVFGFIETYNDPLEMTGYMEGGVMIQTRSLDALMPLLVSIEKQLPYPNEFKRKNTFVFPNASIDVLLCGSGELGPLKTVSAYCLPNYTEIRATDGSRQVIFQPIKSLMELVNEPLYNQLFYLKNQAQWLQKHDPNKQFMIDVNQLLIILHETIGHGSGRFSQHRFVVGDPMLNNIPYTSGDLIDVTTKNASLLLRGYEGALEELRAECLALYVGLKHLEQLAQNGFLTDWVNIYGAKTVREWLIVAMSMRAIQRLLDLPTTAKEVVGEHAIANNLILNYLIKQKGVEVVVEPLKLGDKQYNVVGVKIIDTERVIEAMADLVRQVQALKSTADGAGTQQLIESLGKPMADKHYVGMVKRNRAAIVKNLKVIALMVPELQPLCDHAEIVNIMATWPNNIFDQIVAVDEAALNTSLPCI